MSKHKLKSTFRRGSLFIAVFALVAATIAPATSTYADALNPLTDRSLTLSSSAPGWDYLDGSGNATYAPPNSGANGQKVGNTFDFKVSTNSTATGPGATNAPVKAFTFQYCTTPAGNCTAPGNNDYTEDSPGVYSRNPNGPTEIAAKHSDLEVKIAGGANTSQGTMGAYVTNTSGAAGQNPDGVVSTVPAHGVTGNNFIVYYLNDNDTPTDDSDDVWTASTGWAMTVDNAEDGDVTLGAAGIPNATGANNQIILKNGTGQAFKAGTRVKVVFFATDTNYITNPGSGAFFVRMNTYNSDSSLVDANIIDGGVTVANVMNLGIQITTKVLETMDFSVGVVDPYTLAAAADDDATPGNGGPDELSQLYLANGHRKHSVCEPILTKFKPSDLTSNRLQLGDPNAEFSLRTDTTYSTHSYWRLSSNSSAGATVYYSGNTLTNTVEDDIDAIGVSPEAPLTGSEQFGIALANGTSGPYAVNYNTERAPFDDPNFGVFENAVDTDSAPGGSTANGLVDPLASGIDASVADPLISNLTTGTNPSFHTPQLYPLVPSAAYDQGAGVVNAGYGGINTEFAFDSNSTLIPVPLAEESNQVVNCVTGKMRYIANIAATTPAGIYTTKVNYIASPQY